MLETIAVTPYNLNEASRKSGISLVEVDHMYMTARERGEVCILSIETTVHVRYQ